MGNSTAHGPDDIRDGNVRETPAGIGNAPGAAGSTRFNVHVTNRTIRAMGICFFITLFAWLPARTATEALLLSAPERLWMLGFSVFLLSLTIGVTWTIITYGAHRSAHDDSPMTSPAHRRMRTMWWAWYAIAFAVVFAFF